MKATVDIAAIPAIYYTVVNGLLFFGDNGTGRRDMASILRWSDACERSRHARAVHLADVQRLTDEEADWIGGLIRQADGDGFATALRRFDIAVGLAASHDVAAVRHGQPASGLDIKRELEELDRTVGTANAALSTAAFRSLSGDAGGCEAAAERCRRARREAEVSASAFAAETERRLSPGEYSARQSHSDTLGRAETPLEMIDYARPKPADTRLAVLGVRVSPEVLAATASAGMAAAGVALGAGAAPVAFAAGGLFAASTAAERLGHLRPRQAVTVRFSAAGAGLAAMIPISAQWLGEAAGQLADMLTAAAMSPTVAAMGVALAAAGASLSAVGFAERRLKQADMAALAAIRERSNQSEADGASASPSDSAAASDKDSLRAAAAVRAEAYPLADDRWVTAIPSEPEALADWCDRHLMPSANDREAPLPREAAAVSRPSASSSSSSASSAAVA